MRRLSGPRGVALGGVVLLHAGLVVVIGASLRHSRRSAPAADVVTTVIYLPVPAAHTAPSGDAGASLPALVVPRSTAITLPLPAAPAAPAPIDWDAAARRAAAAAAVTARPLDHNPAVAAAPRPSGPAVAVHQAGEQYREPDGSTQVWVSDRCYLITPAPLPGTPDVIARAVPTRTVCTGGSRGDLFRDLPAYQRYHPAAPVKP
ncbi:MAG: hypothetical protein JSR36_12930 [Proteobacteria bacterium]|nr:hypothetical protein [Pseudomonadota bacterium]